MRLWLDCEFNGCQGELISMALVSECPAEWYQVLPCSEPNEWVQKHVLPMLNKRPRSYDREAAVRLLTVGLARWFRQLQVIHITADYPADLAHLCRVLLLGQGDYVITPPLTLELRRDLPSVSQCSRIPHNALEDARALMKLDLGGTHPLN
jgi:hypothetical protein